MLIIRIFIYDFFLDKCEYCAIVHLYKNIVQDEKKVLYFNQKGKHMTRFAIIGALCAFFATSANASDYTYTETETVTTYERADYIAPSANCGNHYRSSRDVRPASRPCATDAATAQPVRVKTHSEVIDYYQVYQPVTVYKPMGTQIQRRIVPAHPCNKCGM